ncbi:tubulin binding cofactor C-domain-containing protein [Cerioporus squamosus]|nr:tubulin binding cofactor C-domain-containing protein [Cerioporus squamosus]
MSETNQELTQQYHARNQAAISELTSQLESLRTGSATTTTIEKVAAEIARLRKEFSDAIAFLPSYDQRQVDKQLKDLESQLESLRTAAAPKTKFAFKRKAAKAATPAPAAGSTQSTPPAVPPPAEVQASAPTSGLSISGHSHSYLTLSSLSIPWSSASDLTISDLDNCIVNFLPSGPNADVTFTALHARNLSNTVLVLPVITGSALLHDMKNCVIALGSRQFRMHTSSQVDVYISIASNPIIEHCSAIRFADYPACLRRPPASDTNNTQSKSNYLAVQDFSHIRATPSPNWSALPEEAAIRDDRWPLNDVDDVKGALSELLPLRG